MMLVRRETVCDLYNKTGHRIRCMEGLIVQIRKDYAELNQLWKKLERRAIAPSEMEELVRVFSWLRKGLRVFEELRSRGIEGVTWGELEDIERDVKEKEMDVKLNPFSDFVEREYGKFGDGLPHPRLSRAGGKRGRGV